MTQLLHSWRESSQLSPKMAVEEGQAPVSLPGTPLQSPSLPPPALQPPYLIRQVHQVPRVQVPGLPGPFNHPSVSSVAQPDPFHSLCSGRLNFMGHPP